MNDFVKVVGWGYFPIPCEKKKVKKAQEQAEFLVNVLDQIYSREKTND